MRIFEFKKELIVTSVVIRSDKAIDPLHATSHFGHFCIRPFGCCHVGGQKCIVVIEKKALNISLFTNTSEYSNKTCMERSRVKN